MLKCRKNISIKQEVESTPEPNSEPKKETVSEITSRDSLIKILGFRGLEVLENAESQFPNETTMIIEKLSELIKTGEINASTESLDGGKTIGIV